MSPADFQMSQLCTDSCPVLSFVGSHGTVAGDYYGTSAKGTMGRIIFNQETKRSYSSSPNPKSQTTLTVKQLAIMINDDVLLFSATNEETPYEQLLNYLKKETTGDEL